MAKMTLEEAQQVAEACNRCDDSHYYRFMVKYSNEAFPEFLWEEPFEDERGRYNPRIVVKERPQGDK